MRRTPLTHPHYCLLPDSLLAGPAHRLAPARAHREGCARPLAGTRLAGHAGVQPLSAAQLQQPWEPSSVCASTGCSLCRWLCGPTCCTAAAALTAPCGLCIERLRAVQVAVRPYLLYSSRFYEGDPSGPSRYPTASPPPTTILGSVDMVLTAVGTAIEVLS